MRRRSHPLVRERHLLRDQADLEPALQPPCGKPENPPRSILVTGSSGFVAAFLIRELLAHTNASLICLVRAANPQVGRQRIEHNLKRYRCWRDDARQRLTPVCGDLALHRLGLDDDTWFNLARSVDLVVHCGAAVDWFAPYERAAAVNVRGARALLQLAATQRPKRIGYLSSVASCASATHHAGDLLEDSLIDDPEHLLGGYCQTKWVCETMLRAAHARGFDVVVVRLGDVKAAFSTGLGNFDDVGASWHRLCAQTRKAPDVDYQINYLPVDYVAQQVTRLLLLESDKTTFQFSNPEVVPWAQLVENLERFAGPIDLIPVPDWIAKVKADGDPELRRRVLPVFRQLHVADWFDQKMFLDIGTSLYARRHDTSNTRAALKDNAIDCPRANTDGYLERYFEGLAAVGLG